MESVPVKFPVLEGVKVTLIVQPAPLATLEPQVLFCSKLAVVAILSIFSVAEPTLPNVIGCAALVVPTSWSEKVRLVTNKSAVGDPPQLLSRQTAQTAREKGLFMLSLPEKPAPCRSREGVKATRECLRTLP